MTALSIKHNATWLIASEFVSRFILFGVVVWLANSLGSSNFGELSYVFAIANLTVVLADFGIHTYTTRLIAQSVTAWQKEKTQLIKFKLLGSSLSWLLTILIVAVSSKLNLTTVVFGSLAIIIMSARMFSDSIARGTQQMQLEGISKIIHTVFQAIGLTLGIILHWSLPLIALSYSISALLGWLVSLYLVRNTLFTLPNLPSEKTLQTLAVLLLPFATSIAINAQFNYFDSAVLGWFNPKEVVGWYTAAYKPIFFLTALIGLLISAFFPVITKLWHDNKFPEAEQKIISLLKLTMLLGWPIVIIGTLAAPTIFSLLFKPEYAPAVLPFRILLWSTLAIFFWAPLGNSLQAIGQEKLYTKNFIIASIINIPLTIILVYWYNLSGAATATLITQLLLAVLMYKDARKYFKHLW
ncbi:MAG: flippase [Patescibacteria group bacterium]